MTRERINEILGLVLLAISAFLLISFVTYNVNDIPFFSSETATPVNNSAGLIGAYVAFGVFLAVGYCGYLVPFIFAFWAVCMFIQKVPERLLPKIIGFLVMQVSLSCLFSLISPADAKVVTGGLLGYASSQVLHNYLGFAGTFIYAIFCLMTSLLLATEFLIYELATFFFTRFTDAFSGLRDALVRIFNPFKRVDITEAQLKVKLPKKKDDAKDIGKKDKEDPRASLAGVKLKIKKYEDQIKNTNKKSAAREVEITKLSKEIEGKEAILDEEIEPSLAGAGKILERTSKKQGKRNKDEEKVPGDEDILADEEDSKEDVSVGASGPDVETAAEEAEVEPELRPTQLVAVSANENDVKNYQFPKLSLLRDPSLQEELQDDLMANSQLIEKRLADFDIHVKVTEVEQGPVITRYEILPAPGITLASIVRLQDDLGLAMKTPSVRISPVAGKSTIGIEVPNSVTNIVHLKELLANASGKSEKYSLPMFLGKTTSGIPLISDLADMPHLLIAGTTGSGKTVCVNSIIIGMLYKLDPSQLRFVLIDPKIVELSVYNDIPHLLSPVVTDPKKAATVLNWIVQEMENRYKLLAAVGVRNIKTFNTRVRTEKDEEEKIPALMPYIVVVIDELADLMLTASDKVEAAITRLAQLSRAVGIHLILATQRPSVNVITGVIKANFPARLSFKVASKIDSRTVLDMIGADKLIGKGDMLFLQPGEPKPVRAQSAFISDKEIKDIVKFVKEQKPAEYLDAVQDIIAGKISQSGMEKDEMYEEAVNVVLQTGQASVSVLQRRLRLGYARAARIIDMMEANGIVGPYQGSKAREILVDRE
jgi:S-DNA-T family DNA segregation ATPase FtsK/SpoIIIE